MNAAICHKRVTRVYRDSVREIEREGEYVCVCEREGEGEREK